MTELGMTSEEQKAVRSLEEKYRIGVSINPDDAMPDVLYHYTSAKGILGIVKSGALRASNFSYLNDYTEISCGVEVVQKTMDERRNTKESTATRKFFDYVLKTLKDIGQGLDFYLFCLSDRADILSQWRAYGSTKRGRFSIGFDAEALLGFDLVPRRVLYDLDKQKREISRLIDSAIEVLKTSSSPEFAEFVAEKFTRRVISELCVFKDQAYVEEQEWRLVQFVERKDKKIEFETAGGIIRPFIELSTEGRLPIVEIIIGPSSPGSLSERSIELLLTRYGYCAFEIKKSIMPFRDI